MWKENNWKTCGRKIIGKHVEGSGRGVMKVLSRRLPILTKETHGNSVRIYCPPGRYLNAVPPKCEPLQMFAVKLP
jgi:hypothetical protein